MSSSSDDDVFDLGTAGAVPVSMDGAGSLSDSGASLDDEVAEQGPRRRGCLPKAKNKGKAAKEKKEAKAAKKKTKAEQSVFMESESDLEDDAAFIDDDDDDDYYDTPLVGATRRRKSSGGGKNGKRRRSGRGAEEVTEVVDLDAPSEVVDLDASSDEEAKKKERERQRRQRRRARRKVQESESEDEKPPETEDERRRRIAIEEARGLCADNDDDEGAARAAGLAEEEARHAAEAEAARQRREEAARAESAAAPGPSGGGDDVDDSIKLHLFSTGKKGTLTVALKLTHKLRKVHKHACKKFLVEEARTLLLWKERSLPLDTEVGAMGVTSAMKIEVRQSESPIVGLKVRGADGVIVVPKILLGVTDSVFCIRYAVARKWNVDETIVLLNFDGEDIGENDTPESLDIDAEDDELTLIDARRAS